MAPHIQRAYAVNTTISDEASCESMRGLWDSSHDRCSIDSDTTIPSADSWNLGPGLELVIAENAILTVEGTLNNGGLDDY